jgi:hypothetical protein
LPNLAIPIESEVQEVEHFSYNIPRGILMIRQVLLGGGARQAIFTQYWCTGTGKVHGVGILRAAEIMQFEDEIFVQEALVLQTIQPKPL